MLTCWCFKIVWADSIFFTVHHNWLTYISSWICIINDAHQKPQGGTYEQSRLQWTHEGAELFPPPFEPDTLFYFPIDSVCIYRAPLVSHGKLDVEICEQIWTACSRIHNLCAQTLPSSQQSDQHSDNAIEIAIVINSVWLYMIKEKPCSASLCA